MLLNLLFYFIKAEPFDITNHTRLEPLDLSVGRRFDTWVVAENTIKEFGKLNGFVINRHRVEYSKNQLPDSDEKLVKKEPMYASVLESISLIK